MSNSPESNNHPAKDAKPAKAIAEISTGFLSQSWSLFGKAITQVQDASTQVVSQSASKLGTLGEGFLATTGMTRWLSLRTDSDPNQPYDEKHFFLVPYAIATEGYAFATLRVLPPDIPPVNDLPKRRFIHLPNNASKAMLQKLVLEQANADSREQTAAAKNSSINQSLTGIADQLDQIDSHLFYGALALGTVVALINPIAGAVVAAKALTPSIIATLGKYGLRSVGSSFETSAIESKVKAAEADVLKQFSGCNTTEIVNPMLARLALAIRTEKHEFDPVFDEHHPPLDSAGVLAIPIATCNRLTSQAILNVYSDVLENDNLVKRARLGPEDLRWLANLRIGL